MAGKTGAATRSADQSAARHGSGQDRAGGQHVHVPRTEPDAGGDLDQRSSHALRPGVRARRPVVGSRARPEGRRRAEPDRARQELRLAARVVRAPTTTACRSRARIRGPIWPSRSSTGRRSSRRAISRSTTARCSRSGSGSALIGGMATQTLNRITFDGKGGATPAERWRRRPPHSRRGGRVRTARCGCSRTRIPAGCFA